MRILHSLSFRLALTYVALFCISVAVLLGLYYWISIARPLQDMRAAIDVEAQELARLYSSDGLSSLLTALEAREARRGVARPFHAFIAADGRPVAANLPSWPLAPRSAWFEIEADVYSEGDETDYKALTREIDFPDGSRLLVGRDIERIADLRESLAVAGASLVLGTIVLGMLGGFLMSLAIRRRIESVNRAAVTVMDGDLSGRIAVKGTGDDFDRLAQTLNIMLARIEELFEALRRVSDNVAHELRTPLTRLIAKLEQLETLRKRDGAFAGEGTLQEAIGEALRLQRIFDALLRIARIETGRHEMMLSHVDISQLVASAAEFYVPEAEDRGISFTTAIAPDLACRADADLLFQALTNLIDNALKYTRVGGQVHVGARVEAQSLCIEVADNGPGLAPNESDRLTERFYRGASASDVAGEGLGLSLVAAIAKLHSAVLEFADNEPGLAVRLFLPTESGSREQQ